MKKIFALLALASVFMGSFAQDVVPAKGHSYGEWMVFCRRERTRSVEESFQEVPQQSGHLPGFR